MNLIKRLAHAADTMTHQESATKPKTISKSKPAQQKPQALSTETTTSEPATGSATQSGSSSPAAARRAGTPRPQTKRHQNAKHTRSQYARLRRNFDSGWFRRMKHALEIPTTTKDVRLVSSMVAQAVANMVMRDAKLVMRHNDRKTVNESDICYAVRTQFHGRRNIASDGEPFTHECDHSRQRLSKSSRHSNLKRPPPPAIRTAATTEDMSDSN